MREGIFPYGTEDGGRSEVKGGANCGIHFHNGWSCKCKGVIRIMVIAIVYVYEKGGRVWWTDKCLYGEKLLPHGGPRTEPRGKKPSCTCTSSTTYGSFLSSLNPAAAHFGPSGSLNFLKCHWIRIKGRRDPRRLDSTLLPPTCFIWHRNILLTFLSVLKKEVLQDMSYTYYLCRSRCSHNIKYLL